MITYLVYAALVLLGGAGVLVLLDYYRVVKTIESHALEVNRLREEVRSLKLERAKIAAQADSQRVRNDAGNLLL